MRHRMKGKKLNRDLSSRKALVQVLATSLFEHEKIETTLVKAKYIRPYVEKMITMAKNNTLASRRILISKLNDKDLVEKLLADIAPRFKKRAGGYTRIIKTRVRKGDVTEMAEISLLAEDKKEVEKVVLSDEKIRKLVGENYKVVFVPGRLINFVVEE